MNLLSTATSYENEKKQSLRRALENSIRRHSGIVLFRTSGTNHGNLELAHGEHHELEHHGQLVGLEQCTRSERHWGYAEFQRQSHWGKNRDTRRRQNRGDHVD